MIMKIQLSKELYYWDSIGFPKHNNNNIIDFSCDIYTSTTHCPRRLISILYFTTRALSATY